MGHGVLSQKMRTPKEPLIREDSKFNSLKKVLKEKKKNRKFLSF